jgi:hypothetical protein
MPNVAQAVESMQAFQQLKTRLLDDNDTVTISGKRYIKRSGWRKIALAFNISVEITSIEHETRDGIYIVRARAKATAPSGRVSEEIGACDSSEFSGAIAATVHNIETKAATRAINRAISNLVGGGEVSAEEFIEQRQETDDIGEMINRIKWNKNNDGSLWAYTLNKDGSKIPEVETLLALIETAPDKKYIHGGEEFTTDNKYLRRRAKQ